MITRMGSKSHRYSNSPDQSRESQPRMVARQVEISGPLPQGTEFQLYENTVPGAGDRILALAEREATHRHIQEERGLNASLKLTFFGQLSALIVVLSSLGVVAYGVYRQAPLAFIPGLVMGLASLASIFISGKRTR